MELLLVELQLLEQLVVELVLVELLELGLRDMATTNSNRTRVALLIATVAAGAGVALGFGGERIVEVVQDHPGRFVAFLAFTLFLQLFTLRVNGKGSIGLSAVGLVTAGIVLGAGPAMAIAVVAAVVQYARRRGLLHRAAFDASNFALAAGGAAVTYAAVTDADSSTLARFAAATLAGLVYGTVNNGLLCVAMATSDGRSLVTTWQEHFSWAKLHLLAIGPLAASAAIVYDEIGIAALAVFALPPLLVLLSMQRRLIRLVRPVHA